MLPERLSTDLTSLNEAEDRLAVVVSMPITAGGVIGEAALQRALVHNHAKLTYAAVGAWLEGGSVPDAVAAVPGLADNLRLQDAAAQALKKLRQESGALSLETIEPRAVFVGDELADLRAEARNRAKDLIEELMIATNGVTARFLEAHGFASVRRVLKSPERWGRIVEIAAQLRETLPADPDAGALERFLARRRQADPARFPDLSLGVIKLLGSGSYEVEVPGHPAPSHFGLAVQDYAHSTAPNRRYPDVITQRLVKAALDGQPSPYGRSELQALAENCTLQEDNAKKVERQVRKSAAAMLLETRHGESFDGIVTGAGEKGTWVRIFHPPVEGKVVEGEAGLDVGERVRVRLLHTDVERGFIDFGFVAAIS
jgi:exoribonuclease-2